VLKPETINLPALRPEKDGLFCEAIFWSHRDWQCYCGKYKIPVTRGLFCDKCGVEVHPLGSASRTHGPYRPGHARSPYHGTPAHPFLSGACCWISPGATWIGLYSPSILSHMWMRCPRQGGSSGLEDEINVSEREVGSQINSQDP
jgi:DNA-directed RNA polymerase subunit beta'